MDFLREIDRLYNRDAKKFPKRGHFPRHTKIPYYNSLRFFNLCPSKYVGYPQDIDKLWVYETELSYPGTYMETMTDDGNFICVLYHDNSWSSSDYDNIFFSTNDFSMIQSLCMNILTTGDAFIYVFQCEYSNGSLSVLGSTTFDLNDYDITGVDGRLHLCNNVCEGLRVSPNMEIPTYLYYAENRHTISNTRPSEEHLPFYPNVMIKSMTSDTGDIFIRSI